MQFRVLEPLHYQQQVLQSILLGACNVLRIYSNLKKYVLKQSLYLRIIMGWVSQIANMHFLQSLLPWLERKQWSKGWSRLQKKGIKGVEGVGFQNRCVYDVGNGNNSWHAGDLLRGWFSCIRSLQGLLFMQEISPGVGHTLVHPLGQRVTIRLGLGCHLWVQLLKHLNHRSFHFGMEDSNNRSICPSKVITVICWCRSPRCWYLGVVSVDHVDKTNFVCFRISVD